jgi:hypothetical protein
VWWGLAGRELSCASAAPSSAPRRPRPRLNRPHSDPLSNPPPPPPPPPRPPSIHIIDEVMFPKPLEAGLKALKESIKVGPAADRAARGGGAPQPGALPGVPTACLHPRPAGARPARAACSAAASSAAPSRPSPSRPPARQASGNGRRMLL